MAAKFQLEIWDGEPLSGGTAYDTISLLSYTDDFELAYSGYLQDVGENENTPIIERIKLMVKESSHDNISASLQDLAKYIDTAKFANESNVATFTVWLRMKLTNETGERVSYIYDIRVEKNDKMNQVTLAKSAIPEYTLIIKRAPYWERDVNARSLTAALTTYNLTNPAGVRNMTVYGDVTARLRYMQFGVPAGAAIAIDELWWGWISETRFPQSYIVPGVFIPTWKLEDAGSKYTDTSLATVSGSVGTQVLQTTFSSATAMTPRAKIALYDVYSIYTQSGYGRFMVLLRAGLSGAGECHVRLGVGACNATWNLTDPFAKRCRVSVTKNTGWYIYPLGVVQFPIGGYLSAGELAPYQGLQIEAERISGSVSLNMDCLYLIPIAEGWGHAKGITAASDTTWGVEIGETYQAGKYARYFNNATALPAMPVVEIGGRVPYGSSAVALFVVGQREASSVNGDTIDIDQFYIKDSYRDLRGTG